MFNGIKSWFSNYSFKYPWDAVVYAASYKYPNNFNPNVKHIDVISRHIDDKTGIMFTHKLLTTEWPMFSSFGKLYASEYSAIDPQNRRMILVSFNHSISSLLVAKERLEYIQDPNSDQWTLMNQSTTIEAFSGFLDSIISTYKANALKGREAIEWVINNRLPLLPRIPECQKLISPSAENEIEQFMSHVETCWDDLSRDVTKAKDEIISRSAVIKENFTNLFFENIYVWGNQFA